MTGLGGYAGAGSAPRTAVSRTKSVKWMSRRHIEIERIGFNSQTCHSLTLSGSKELQVLPFDWKFLNLPQRNALERLRVAHEQLALRQGGQRSGRAVEQAEAGQLAVLGGRGVHENEHPVCLHHQERIAGQD